MIVALYSSLLVGINTLNQGIYECSTESHLEDINIFNRKEGDNTTIKLLAEELSTELDIKDIIFKESRQFHYRDFSNIYYERLIATDINRDPRILVQEKSLDVNLSNSIAITTNFAIEKGLVIDDVFTVSIGINSVYESFNFTIGWIIHTTSDSNDFFCDYLLFSKLFHSVCFNELSIFLSYPKVNSNYDSYINKQITQIVPYLDENLSVTAPRLSFVGTSQNELSAIQASLTNLLLPIFLLFVVILSSIWLLRFENLKKQFGILISLGTSMNQLLQLLLIQSVIISIIGTIIGFPIGMLTSTFFVELVTFLNPTITKFSGLMPLEIETSVLINTFVSALLVSNIFSISITIVTMILIKKINIVEILSEVNLFGLKGMNKVTTKYKLAISAISLISIFSIAIYFVMPSSSKEILVPSLLLILSLIILILINFSLVIDFSTKLIYKLRIFEGSNLVKMLKYQKIRSFSVLISASILFFIFSIMFSMFIIANSSNIENTYKLYGTDINLRGSSNKDNFVALNNNTIIESYTLLYSIDMATLTIESNLTGDNLGINGIDATWTDFSNYSKTIRWDKLKSNNNYKQLVSESQDFEETIIFSSNVLSKLGDGSQNLFDNLKFLLVDENSEIILTIEPKNIIFLDCLPGIFDINSNVEGVMNNKFYCVGDLNYVESLFKLTNSILIKTDPSVIDIKQFWSNIRKSNDGELAVFDQVVIPEEIIKIKKQQIMPFISIFFIEFLVFLLFNILILVYSAYANILKRKREIGILLTLGSTKYQIFTQFFLEGLLLQFIGILVGFISCFFINIFRIEILITISLLVIIVTFFSNFLFFNGIKKKYPIEFISNHE